MYRLATPGKYMDIKKNLSDHLAMATVPQKYRHRGVPYAGYYTFKISAARRIAYSW